jgi:hypothetical protein
MRPHLLFFVGLVASAAIACGVTRAPAPSCVDYVACVQARDAARGATTDVERFLPDGACWTSAQEAADACAEACARGLDVLRSLVDAPAECGT